MTYPRESLICLQATPYYHVVSRCVRRAWLWGFDEYAGRDYSHRKDWVRERLRELSSAFAIDICAYLNPIRAGIATTPEESEFTSIYARIQALRTAAERVNKPSLFDFHTPGACAAPVMPFTLEDYLTLVDWSGRAVRADKRGAIDPQLPPLLRRLNIDAEAWQATMQPRGKVFGRALGRLRSSAVARKSARSVLDPGTAGR